MELNLKEKLSTLFSLVSEKEKESNPALRRQSMKLSELVTRYRDTNPKESNDEQNKLSPYALAGKYSISK